MNGTSSPLTPDEVTWLLQRMEEALREIWNELTPEQRLQVEEHFLRVFSAIQAARAAGASVTLQHLSAIGRAMSGFIWRLARVGASLEGAFVRLTNVLGRFISLFMPEEAAALGGTAAGGTAAGGATAGGAAAGTASTSAVLGVLGIGLAEVLWFFSAGLALPASKMGELSIELPGDKSALHAWEALISAYQEHVRQRDDYKHAPTAHKQLELRNSVYALRKEILHFLHAHPHDPHKSDVEAMFQQVDEWYNQYSYSTFPTAPVPPPSPAPPASPQKPPAKEPVPPTIAKPPTLEWLEGERIRHMIQFHKEWLRKWKKKRKEAEPWEDWYKKEIDKAIARETEEIEKPGR